MRSQLAMSVLIGALTCSGAAYGAVAYDFETALDGFGPNGGAFPVVADTIGATNGPTSMKVDIPGGATFVGALTSTVPAVIGDPPGVASVTFDLTIVDEYAGAFADLGVTIFGASQPDFPGGQLFGLQAQFADLVSLGGLAAGTHEVTIDFDSATNPLTFGAGESFDDIFGGFGTGPNDLIPTGFQFFVSKSNDAAATFYIDNVTTTVPEPTTVAMIALGMTAVLRRRSRG